MKMRLTDLGVKKLSLPKAGQVTHWDETTPGFGIRCSPKSKSYVVMYAPERRLKTLGRYPDLPLAEARNRAKLFQVARRQTQGHETVFNFRTVVDEYFRDCRERLRDSTFKGYRLYLTHITFDGPISDVTQGQVIRAIERFTSSSSSQNYAFTTFKVFFNWAVRRQFVQANPLIALSKPHKVRQRERVLSDEELQTVLSYTFGCRGRFNDVVTLLALTGQRRGEIANLRWSEIDGGMLILPADRTKNKREHLVPLGTTALTLLHEIEGGNQHVFGTPADDTPFNGWSRAQRRLVRDTGVGHFTLHDLRRTFSTIHAKLGTPIHVTEKLLNHVSGTISGVAAVYNRHSYLEEMRLAMAKYDAHVSGLLERA